MQIKTQYIPKSVQEMAEEVAKEALDNYIHNGFTLREWANKIICNEYQPVKHGQWQGNILPPSKNWFCSECKNMVETAYYCYRCYYDYCPNCGAKMEELKNENK